MCSNTTRIPRLVNKFEKTGNVDDPQQSGNSISECYTENSASLLRVTEELSIMISRHWQVLGIRSLTSWRI